MNIKRIGTVQLLSAAAMIAVLPLITACAANPSKTVYVAELQPLNASVADTRTTGKATLVAQGDTLTIRVHVEDAPPNIVHWQHFHGFKDGSEARCPTHAADANGDGIIGLIETEAVSGTTMVPFDAAPAAMDVAHGDYPKADPTGAYTYEQTVSLEALQAAFAEAFDGAKLNLESRVIYIHGVRADTDLPESVASLGPIPAHTTLPIACGALTVQTR